MSERVLSRRLMQMADLEAIMHIELQAYEYPWTQGIFADCLQQKNYRCVLLEHGGEILAYTVLSLMAQELHILNLTVSPQQRRRGLARDLLKQAEDWAYYKKAELCFLEVRASNQAAIQLYLQQGFNELDIRKRYYPAKSGREDALMMAKTLL